MKFIATILATLALLFGGTVTLAPAASATDVAGPCQPGQPCEPPTPATPTCLPDETVNEYRATIATQAEWLEAERDRGNELQAVASRLAYRVARQRATIEKLRAKIRSLR